MMFRSEVLMFTGIVEEVGRITKIEQRGENRRITIAAGQTPEELGTGGPRAPDPRRVHSQTVSHR